MKIIKLMFSMNRPHSFSFCVKLKDPKFSAQLERWIGSDIKAGNQLTFKSMKVILVIQESF